MRDVAAVALAVILCALASPAHAQDRLVERVVITGNHRIPESSIVLWIQTRSGDSISHLRIERDLRTVLAQGFFADAKVFTEDGTRGGIVVIFEVRELPVILDLDFPGLKTVSQADVLAEWQRRSVSISKESQFDPVRARRAASAIVDLLARKGHPNARVEPQAEDLSTTSVALHFRTEEGERVRVASIDFDGNTALTDAQLRAHMKLVKEAGLISGLTSKDIYDKEKIRYDLQNVTRAYWSRGYLDVKIGEPVIEEAGRVGSGVPLVGGSDAGLRVTVSVEEGRVYHVGQIVVEGATVFPRAAIETAASVHPDAVVDLPAIQAALDGDIARLYGDRGYVDFEARVLPTLSVDPLDPSKGVADLTIHIEEGQSYNVGRIEFKGNTFTRDKTIRREIPLTEGTLYSKRLFDLSILRLNQLGYFAPIHDTDADIRTNSQTRTVDVDYRFQEKGPQQFQVSAGGSGIEGSFYGVQYSTTNLLGYGESLSFDAQAGDRSKQFSVGFTEPYVLDHPVSAGLQLFYRDLRYLNTGTTSPNDVLFTQRSLGGAVSVSTPLSVIFARSTAARFAHLGLSYSYRTTSVDDPASTLATDPSGTLALSYAQSGIVQATLTPTFVYSTVDGGLDPTRGQQLSLGVAVSGGPAGGDVHTIQPTLDYRFFRPLTFFSKDHQRPDVFAVRFSAGHVRAFGNPLDTGSLSFVGGTPFLTRYFLGGEDTIRGYDVGTIAPTVPVAQFVTQTDVSAIALNGQPLGVALPRDANRRTIAPGPIRKLTKDALAGGTGLAQIGGDTQLLMNVEYRVPLPGPFSMAAFADVGSVYDLRALADQSTITNQSNIPLSNLVIVDPRGRLATAASVADATTPETPPTAFFPPGFRAVQFMGDREVETQYRLGWAADGFRENLRSTLGAELRVQIPVVNLPVRVILGYNPSEGRTVFRFAIGRTF